MVNEYKIKKFYYLSVVIIVILGCIYMAVKTIKINKYDGNINFASNIENPKSFITPDIVPHFDIPEPPHDCPGTGPDGPCPFRKDDCPYRDGEIIEAVIC